MGPKGVLCWTACQLFSIVKQFPTNVCVLMLVNRCTIQLDIAIKAQMTFGKHRYVAASININQYYYIYVKEVEVYKALKHLQGHCFSFSADSFRFSIHFHTWRPNMESNRRSKY